MRIAAGGAVIQLRGPENPSRAFKGGKRAAVKDFSRSARRRMMVYVNSINRTAIQFPPLLLTLTYPADWPTDGSVWKTHLDIFLKRLHRLYPAAGAVWKLEFQQRGAPHFHLLLFNIWHLDKAWVARVWCDIAGGGELDHLRAGTRIERVRSWRGVTFYAAKYLGKPGAVPIGIQPGRFWGVFNRAALPVDWIERTLSYQQFAKLRRFLWHLVKSRGGTTRFKGPCQGATVFVDDVTAHRLCNASL